MVRQTIKRGLAVFGLSIKRNVPPQPVNPIRPWETDKQFLDLLQPISEESLVDPSRLYVLDKLARHVAALDGDFAEIGVYRGGTARLFHMRLQGTAKHLYLFDTFQGMPETDAEKDWHKKGDFSDTSLERVKAFVGEGSDVSFCPGIFPDTAGTAADKTFALVHIDVDIYRSVLDCCDFFYSRMVSGGVMIFDDYGFTTCPGAKEAVDAFFRIKSECPLYLPTGQAIVFKHPWS